MAATAGKARWTDEMQSKAAKVQEWSRYRMCSGCWWSWDDSDGG